MTQGLLSTLAVRPGTSADFDAVAALHGRCSMRTLFNRYHSGMSTVPRRWLHRLLHPVRGTSLVVECDGQVIALGQLLHTGLPGSAEVSLLVEDAWQRRGVGTELLAALVSFAGDYDELVAWCLPSENSLVRTACRAGLATATRREDGLLRVSIDPRGRALMTPVATVNAEKTR
jgi:GNAT superfamily N-acetyltransferase